MALKDIKPSSDLATLQKQFAALRTLAHCIEMRCSSAEMRLHKDNRIDHAARETLDSERKANEILTDLTVSLEARNEVLLDALRAIERHHVKQNAAKGRAEGESFTLRTCRNALRGDAA